MKLGRLPRTFDPRIPKMENVRTAQPLPPLPASVDYSAGMPSDLGAMLNNSQGDCTCAAVGHAIQVWTHNVVGLMLTPPDSAIEALYEKAGGYVPGNAATDQGAIEQVVLGDWLNTPVDGNELSAFVEVSCADLNAVRRTIWECGVAYIGFNVPAYLMNTLTAPGATWDVAPTADNTIVGGHAVILCGYDATGNMRVISWGNFYTMTPAFWQQRVDECYALANPAWIAATGNSPAGLTLPELTALMQELKG